MSLSFTYDPYQGDPKKILTAHGATLQFKDGQPLMDAGIENAIMYSLFTKHWFANVFFRDPAQRFDSKFEIEAAKPITVDQLLNIEDAAKDALKWMIDKNILSRVEAEASVPEFNRLEVRIRVYPPGSDGAELLLTKNAQNWIAQAYYPANERVTVQ
jgi:phage gp46-like protein